MMIGIGNHIFGNILSWASGVSIVMIEPSDMEGIFTNIFKWKRKLHAAFQFTSYLPTQ